MIKTTFLILLIIVTWNFPMYAQITKSETQIAVKTVNANGSFTGFVFPSHDSILHANLGTIEMIGPYPFKNRREEKKYSQLEVDLLKTYPLALIVSSELKIVNTEFESNYMDQAKRKVYIKWYQKYVYKTYFDSLKTLNSHQGHLLLKLIHRETGKTPYELIKAYRGGFNAFVWQSLAFMAGANLNSNYDPNENIMIEHIIRRYKSGEFN